MAAPARDIQTIKAGLLGSDSRLRRVNLEILLIAIKACETKRGRAFDKAQDDAAPAQCNDAQYRIRSDANKIARVNLYFQSRILRCRKRIAFNQRQVERGALPLLIACAPQVNLSFEQTRAHHTRRHIIFISVRVLIIGAHNHRSIEQYHEREEKGDEESFS
jgi:hypothetical protein